MAGSAGAAIGRRLGMIGRHGAPPQLMQKAQHLLVRHVLALVIAIVMNNLVEGAADRGTAVDGGKADRQDMVDHQEIGHAEHALNGSWTWIVTCCEPNPSDVAARCISVAACDSASVR